jgi:predicted lipoprotein
MISFRFKNVLFVAITFFLVACDGGSSDPNPDALDRTPMLTHWVDNIVVPSYAKFKIRFDEMATASDAFMASPNTTTLAAFRTSWADAYTSWQTVELFEFGPGDRNTIRNFFNIYPADEAGINANIQDPAANLALPATYARQGFPALDYLINGLGTTDSEVVSFYTTDADAAKRLAYVDKLVDRMHTILTTVITEWSGSAREAFISSTGVDIGSSTALVVNAYVLNYERYIRTGKFGIPSGAMVSSGGTKYPEKVEGYYKRDLSLTLAQAAHQASIDFFNGRNVNTGEEGPSFKSYLDALEAKDPATGTLLSELINTQFSVITASLQLLNNNLHDEVANNNQKMIDTFNEMQKAVRMLKVDLTSAMSITITYTDNDGD